MPAPCISILKFSQLKKSDQIGTMCRKMDTSESFRLVRVVKPNRRNGVIFLFPRTN